MSVEINETNFPDNKFRQYISDNFDLDDDGYLNDSEIASATRIDISSFSSAYSQLQSVEGIEHLKHLTYFYAYCNAQSIDFSFNDELEFIYVNDHSLTSVVFGEQKKLTHVGISTSPITSIDLSDCMFVEELNTAGCYALNELIIGNLNAIKKMWLFKLNLGDFDAGLYPNMTDLTIYGSADESAVTGRHGPHGETINAVCGIESLTAINHTALTTIVVDNYGGSQSLSEVDLTGSVNLTKVWLTRCHNLNSITGLTDLSSLSSLNTSWSPITELDISHSAILVDLFRNGNVANDGNVKSHYYERGDYEEYLSYSSYYGTKIRSISADPSAGPISIVTQPSSAKIVEGSSATFTVEASGNDLSYQWQVFKNGQWASIQNATSPSYTVDDAQVDSDNRYRCIVSNDAGDEVISDIAILTVNQPGFEEEFAIISEPKDVTALAGRDILFSVTVQGQPTNYQWQTSDDGLTWGNVTDNGDSDTYRFVAGVAQNGHYFRCIVSKGSESLISRAAILHIKSGSQEWGNDQVRQAYLPSEMADAIRKLAASGVDLDDIGFGLMPDGLAKDYIGKRGSTDPTWYEEIAEALSTIKSIIKAKTLKFLKPKVITENGEYAAVDDDCYGYTLVEVKRPLGQTGGKELVERTISGAYIDDSIERIGPWAFAMCDKLETVNCPSCQEIGSSAFLSCSKLTECIAPMCSKIGDYAFYKCQELYSVDFSACSYIGKYAFQECRRLQTVVFPKCTEICYGAFYQCSGLQVVNLSSCEKIGNAAFAGCSNLQTVYLTGSSVCKLMSSNALAPIYSGDGKIYVPTSLYASYVTASEWSYYSSKIYPLSASNQIYVSDTTLNIFGDTATALSPLLVLTIGNVTNSQLDLTRGDEE